MGEARSRKAPHTKASPCEKWKDGGLLKRSCRERERIRKGRGYNRGQRTCRERSSGQREKRSEVLLGRLKNSASLSAVHLRSEKEARARKGTGPTPIP